jgi:signal transduction histidine kinase/CheY-like chemotaxis protein
MNPLVARDALTTNLKRVNVDQRPGFDTPAVFAVFESDEPQAPLVGLVTSEHAANYSERIFADLLPANRGTAVSADSDLESVSLQMEKAGTSALSVLDGAGHLLGAVTRESLWAAMLVQQRGLMAELASTEAQQRAMLNAMPDELLCVTAEGRMLPMRQSDRVAQRGPSARPLEAEDSRGKAIADVFPADVAAALKSGIAQSRASGTPGHAAFSIAGPDATLQYEARFISWGEGKVLIVCRDVTEVNALRAKMIQSDRMISIGTLAAGVAHEINNPLTYVSSNLVMLDELLAPEIFKDESLREAGVLLADVRDGIDRVRRTVKDLKLLSRSDEGARSPIDLKEVVTRVLRIANNEIRHRATLSLDIGDIPLVDANDGQLGQVLLNLLVNAAQAITEGAADRNQIRVVTRTDPQGRAVVEVHDTGSGMPDDVKSRIFAPFFTTKDVGVGTGLGLSICQGIIVGHGGMIEVESTVGKGSLFRIVLPASAGRALAVITRRALSSTGAVVRPTGRFLLVDDERLILATYRRLLGAGQCTLCTSGREALDLLRQGERFDAILCDLMMPDVSGMDVYDELTRIAPEQAVRMIFITGGGFTERSRRFLAQRTNPVLEKPFKTNVLFEAIAETGRIPGNGTSRSPVQHSSQGV